MNTRRWVRALAAVAILAPAGAWGQGALPAAAPNPEAVRDAERELWLPGQARYIRSWQVRTATGVLENEATLAPTAATAGEWKPYTAWTDVAEINGPAGGAGSAEAPKYAYAFAAVERAAAGPAELALGSTAPAKVWVNGRLLGESAGGPALARDAVRLPVQLNAGHNAVLVRTESRGGPWQLTARILSPNQPVAVAGRLAASIEARDGVLTVRTDARPGEAPATVTVIAPGGRTVAEAQVPRGETASFPTGAWADGPYEVRVLAADGFGQPARSYLPWYKGDPRPAAQALLARAAAAGSTAEAGHWRMLADLLRDRAGADLAKLDASGGGAWAALFEAAELQQGPAALVRPGGFVRLAWIDPVDGSTQFCRAYLPADYDGTTPKPLVLYLHGYNPDNPPYVGFWRVDDRHMEGAERHGVIFIEAHGRANTQYVGIGEKDVLNCLEAARRRFKVDDERTYLTGESMGGAGTWTFGSRHPDRFAAIAPVFGGWDNRLRAGAGFDNPAADRPMERWAAETQSSFAGAEQLINTPVFVMHGDQDKSVDVAFSRHIVRRLQRWGYDVRYKEYPGLGHEDMQQLDETIGWFLQHRRATSPRQVRIRSVDLTGAKAWWVEVEGAMQPMAMIEADAEMVEPGVLRLDTRNVAAVALSPPAALLRPGRPLKVVWNGEAREASPDGQGRIRLSRVDAPRGPLLKRTGLSGGLSDAFTTPYVIVVGTSSPDPQMRRLIREKAQFRVVGWRNWQHVQPRIVDDTAVTPEMERTLTLVLIGGPAENRIARRLARDFPLKVEKTSVTVSGRRFAAADAVAEMIRPSPWAPDRYVLMVAPTSATGMYAWNPSSFWFDGGSRITPGYDWTIIDARLADLPQGLMPERVWVASGVFDQAWRRDDRWTFLGDPEARARAQPVQLPRTDLALSEAQLDRYVGAYELMPGVQITFKRDGGVLWVKPPNGAFISLAPQSETIFATPGMPVRLEFVPGPDGKVTEVRVNDGQQNTVWRPVAS